MKKIELLKLGLPLFALTAVAAACSCLLYTSDSADDSGTV